MFSVSTILDDTGDPADDLTTVEDVLEVLNIDGDSDTNARLQSWISRYSKIIAKLCNRQFAKKYTTQTFYLDACESISELVLDRYPVEQVFSIEIDDSEVSTDDYAVDAESGLVKHLCGMWRGRKIAVTYTGGYDLPDGAPSSLAAACIEFVKDQNLAIGRDPSIREVSQGDSTVSFWSQGAAGINSALPPGVEDLISQFRRLSV